MRQFKNLEEVLENIDNITFEEAHDVSDRLGIVFTGYENGKYTGAEYMPRDEKTEQFFQEIGLKYGVDMNKLLNERK